MKGRSIITIGFIGLGNVGAKLAGTLQRNGIDLIIHDIEKTQAEPLLDQGAAWATSPRDIAARADVIITCLPSPQACATVMESDNGILAGLSDGAIWMEMSTTDEAEVKRLGGFVIAQGGRAADCPVSGGCHRAASGNIAILAGCDRDTFDAILPILTIMGNDVLHTGPLGSASTLKVVTNYLATANLVSVCEALTVSKAAGMDLDIAYEAIRISSGNSFVHETESQVILNGSRDINFTIDLVLKDVGLFQEIGERAGVGLELSPVLLNIFKDGQSKYGAREWSPNIIRRLEDATGLQIFAEGFPSEIVDHEPEVVGREIRPKNYS